MNTEMNVENLASSLGEAAARQATLKAEQICGWEKQRIGKANASAATGLKARLSFLMERRSALQKFLERAPLGDPAALRRRRCAYWAIAAMLYAASVFFAHLALAPFGLGWETWIMSLAIGVVAPLLIDQAP